MYSSPELMDRIRHMERDYQAAVRQFYCRPPPSMPGLQGAVAAAAAEQPTSGPQPGLQPDTPWPDTPRPDTPQPDTPQPDSRPDTPQPGMTPDPKSASTPSTRRRGRRKRDAPA
ncbi:hypothetical protein GOODEAATRI_034548 [Goodea atripinnis]|uniref:Uncharacterized protein n=1 Tax=Goodea atripinnis TaxID=208336 RepID=A0ABV0PJL6_9TELE